MVDKDKILAAGRRLMLIELPHTQLHSKPWHKSIPEEHTLL